MRYSKLYMDDDRLRNSIELQVLARRNSKKITLPKNFIPRTQLDRFVWRNLVMDWPFEKIQKTWPMLTVNFVNRNLFGK
jgi:hypothetical protein